jgi:hypothetical protein
VKFVLLIVETPESKRHLEYDRTDHRRRLEGWMTEQGQAGKLLGGEAFESCESATTIRRQAGAAVVTGGPFNHGSETVGGYVLLDATDHDEAVEIAKSWPTGETIEVRQVWATS